MFKKLFVVALSITAFLCCLFLPNNLTALAETKQSITYVAFGDSIAKAYAINLKTKSESEELIIGADNSFELIDGSYVDLIRDSLNATYDTTAYNFSKSGDDCQDLLDFIYGFYDSENNQAKDATNPNARFGSLTNEQVYNNVKNANVITVCIGANNILSFAPNLMMRFLGVQSPSITRAEMESQLRDYILGTSEIKGLKAEFEELLTVLAKINPNANIYFTNVYNPYKVLKGDPTILYYVGTQYQSFTQANLDIISEVADMAIGGGTDSSGNAFTGINNVIYNTILESNNAKFKYIDTKSQFDAKYNSTNPIAYNEYVNVQLEKITTASITSGEVDFTNINAIAYDYLDPHPTYEGHKIIANTHTNAGLLPYLPEQEEFECSITCNDAPVQNSYNLNSQGASVVLVANVTTQGYTYEYSYQIKKDDSLVKTISANTATISFDDFDAGTYDVYLTITATKDGNITTVYTDEKVTSITIDKPVMFEVSFVTNCDATLPSISVEQNSKIEEPTIYNENHELLGWYTESSFENEWDFDVNVVTSNLTLYAKWQAITFNVTFNYNGGIKDEQTIEIIPVVRNETVEPPAENPTLEKHNFLGWFVSLDDEQSYDFTQPITADLTLYAKWERVVFNVTFNYNGGILLGEASDTVEVNKGEKVAKPTSEQEPSKEDYSFTGWYVDAENTTLWNFEDAITEDITLYAGWEICVCFVTFDYNGGMFNGATSKTVKINIGDCVVDTIGTSSSFQKEGYKFAYWYKEVETDAFDFNTPILTDVTLYAFWKEAITINIYNMETGAIERVLFKGTVVFELYDIVKPSINGSVFLGWYKDGSLNVEYNDDEVLENNQNVFVKWVTLSCKNENLLKQAFSPITKLIEWHIDAPAQSNLQWQVNGETVKEATVTGDAGADWSFAPTGVGLFVITCAVDGKTVNGKTVEITYSIPSEISITLSKVADKKTYYFEVDNRQYYNESKFVWFKTEDGFSDDFSIKIGTGYELAYRFDSDCKVCVKYLENEDATDGLVSNILEVKVDNYVDESTLLSIAISAGVIALIVVGVILSKRRYNDSF